MRSAIRNFIRDEQGQDLIEYSLVLAFVVGTTALIANGFRGSIAGVATVTNSNLDAAGTVVR